MPELSFFGKFAGLGFGVEGLGFNRHKFSRLSPSMCYKLCVHNVVETRGQRDAHVYDQHDAGLAVGAGEVSMCADP